MAIAQYLEEVHRYPLLSRDEEKNLGAKVQLGDESAREKLINSNLRLVMTIAREIAIKYNHVHELEDLIQEGNRGLMRAVDKYNPSSDARFATYASWWIRQRIYRYLEDNGRTIRLPKRVQESQRKISETIREYIQETGEKPSYEEISLKLKEKLGRGYSPEEIKKLLDLISITKTTTLDEFVYEDDDRLLIDFVRDERENPEELASKSILRGKLEAILKELKPKYRDVLRLRFGFYDEEYNPNEEEHTFKKIREKIGVSAERVRQIQNKALKKLEFKLTRRPFHNLSRGRNGTSLIS